MLMATFTIEKLKHIAMFNILLQRINHSKISTFNCIYLILFDKVGNIIDIQKFDFIL